MAESGGLLINGPLQIQLLDDASRSEIEIVANDADDVLLGAATFDRAVGLNVDGEWVGEADSVGDLEKGPIAEASRDQ